MQSKIVVVIVLAVSILLFASKSALACKGSQVLFEDNFAILDPSWGDQNANLSVANGKLTIQPEVNQSYTVINQANLFEDMDACVKISLAKSDDPNYGGGFVFWAKGYNDYYYLMITGDGWFTVRRWTNNRSLEPVPWRQNSALKKTLGEVNLVRVMTKGSEAKVYINDTEVITFKGQPPEGGGFIGFTGNSPANVKNKNVWEFSELKVTKLEAATVTTPTVSNESKGGEVLLEDNFATLDPGWGAATDNFNAANGKLTLQADLNAGLVGLNQSNRFEDMDASIKVNMAKSDDQAWGGGLVFWATDYDNYYAVLVSANGQFSVRRYVNARSLAPVDWRDSTVIQKGIGQVNQLRVVTKGSQATVYINGVEVVTFNGQLPQGGGFIGVKGSSAEKSQIVWEFSELKVTKPSPSNFPG